MKQENKFKNNILISILLFAGTFFMYLWTIKLPIMGDGLMHLSDETHISSIKDLFKIFYTFDGVGKPAASATLNFHRPIFNELIVPVIKYITNDNTFYIRLISIVVHSINTVLAYFVCYIISEKREKSIIGSIIFAASLTYFSGIYEFGLSFSLWLTLFSLVALIFTIKYEKEQKTLYLVLALFASFVAVFTKESAVVLGVALSFYVVIKYFVKNRTIDKKSIIYVTAQFGIIILYFVTRYNKLGSIFGIAGGIEGKVNLTDSIQKVIGYFFLLFNIPNKVIPSFMIAYLDRINLLATIIFIGLTLFILLYAMKCFKEAPIKNINILIGIIMYCILISTTFKVIRNSQYYGDLAMLGILIFIASIDFSNKKKYEYIFRLYAIVYIICFGLLVKVMVSNDQWYLSMGTNQTAEIQNDIVKSVPKKEKVYQATSFLKVPNDLYIFNHGEIGSFYKYNIDKATTVKMLDETTVNYIDNNSLIVDYIYEKGNNNIRTLYKTKDNTETNIIKIRYNQLDNYSEILEINYEYEGKIYYQNIDLNFQKSLNNGTLYFVVPKDVLVNCTTQYVQSIERIE